MRESPNTPGSSDRGRKRARALLGRGAEGLQGPSGAGRGRGRLCDGAPALQHRADRSPPRPRLHRADARRSRARRARADARAARSPGWQPPDVPRTLSTGAGRAGVTDRTRGRLRARPVWKALPRRHAQATYTPERIGMLSMLCLVFVFGIHSLADWTWYVPGDAFVALLCAGWLAGRGPWRLRAPASCPRLARALCRPARPARTTDMSGPSDCACPPCRRPSRRAAGARCCATRARRFAIVDRWDSPARR